MIKGKLAYKNSSFFLLLAARDILPGGISALQQQQVHTDDVTSVRNLVRSSDWCRSYSSYIVWAIIYKQHTNDKWSQRSNVIMMNLQQNSQY